MSIQVIWTKTILEQFIKQGNLTKEQEMIMRTRCAGWTRVKQSIEFGMSLSTIDRYISRLKSKYDVAQRHSVILPPRKSSATETYLDNYGREDRYDSQDGQQDDEDTIE